MNLREKFRYGIEQLWKNRKYIQAIICHLVPILMIWLIVTQIIIALTNWIRLHFGILLFLCFVFLAFLDVCQKEKAQIKVNSNHKIMRAPIHNDHWKIFLLMVQKFSVLRFKASSIILLITDVFSIELPQEVYITLLVTRALFDPARGNPLCLKEGQYLPTVHCKKRSAKQGGFVLQMQLEGFTPEQIKNLAPVISPALIGRVKNYAVTKVRESISRNYVQFIIEDVTIDHRLVFSSVEEMLSRPITKLIIDKRTTIDLTTSGSIICAGKTRSGKTTGIVSQLLQIVPYGPDKYGSECIIVDPKRAELSRLPHTVTVDKDGGGREILAAVKRFADSIAKRQNLLNMLSEVDGNAVHWCEAAMHPSFLVLDEFVSLRLLFPKRADKEDPEYCLAVFDALLKRIVTMGASAGCYVIISIAEASVEEGGLPAMLRSAMSTRILFRPTMPEARLLWSAEKLENLPDRAYQPGDAWFSSTDGEHDEVSFVRFPQMNFPIYRELGYLLEEYYSETRAGGEAER